MGLPVSGHPYHWVPYPWYVGASPNASSPGTGSSLSNPQLDGSLPTTNGVNSAVGSKQVSGSGEPGLGSNPYPGVSNAAYGSGFNGSGTGANPYPNFPPGFLPFPIAAVTGRPEPSDPLYVSTADDPELKLISLHLTGSENYSKWSQDFRRALVTKDKDGFLDGIIPIPSDERLARHWRKCNHLIRTWIGNCISPEVAAGLPPTEDSKRMWDNIKKMYGKLD
ncbi:uncharacterized protein LOC104430173 [Eucalyptus grandis]|uniref:uncharacterized protein LOC104430173 n=1 Tax=Eucalyptus grandis TaxID=71139 RepID=UPI00052493AE|nr:uncharacterized protein LOC104430173 [Eucalyptus grandis]